MLAPWKKSYDKRKQLIKKQRYSLTDKCPSSQSYGFSSSNVWIWELDYKENWVPKNWCFWTVLLENLQSPLDCKEIKSVNPKGNQFWIFTGRTGAEAPIFWPPDVKYQLIEKDPDAGKEWRQEEKGTIEDEMVGWHHQLNGQEFEQASGDGEGQGSLVCCSPWGHKESDMTAWQNNNKKEWVTSWQESWGIGIGNCHWHSCPGRPLEQGHLHQGCMQRTGGERPKRGKSWHKRPEARAAWYVWEQARRTMWPEQGKWGRRKGEVINAGRSPVMEALVVSQVLVLLSPWNALP